MISRIDEPFTLKGRRVWVAGHGGMLGQALIRRLREEACNILTCDRQAVDLRNQRDTELWVAANKPEVILLAAATVGGILANNNRPAEFIYDNLAIELNVIEGGYKAGVSKLVLLGSSCIYPRLAQQPIREETLLEGPLEPTNQWYAVAKIAGIKLCQAYRRQYGADYIAVMPTNLYGPCDNFNLESSHVVPALIRKINDAKLRDDAFVEIWGSGNPRREFLYVDDCADAIVHVLQYYSGEQHINIGTGCDVTIRQLAEMVAHVVGYSGEFRFNTSMPDGTPRKLLDVSRLARLGWRAQTELQVGLERTYKWYCSQLPSSPS